jgi:type II secretory pathway predicted ATPase ExeA
MMPAVIRPAYDPAHPPVGARLNAGTVLALLGLQNVTVQQATGLGARQLFELLSENRWPAGFDAAELRQTIERLAHEHGATPLQISTLWHAYRRAEARARPAVPTTAGAAPGGTPPPALAPPYRPRPRQARDEARALADLPYEDPNMLLPKQSLSLQARNFFALSANPFDGEVTASEEMFCSDELRYIREVCWQAATSCRFVAVVGESGSGKTTLLADLKERIAVDRKPVVVIEPSVLGMEETDTRGKVLKAADILTAIVMTLAPQAVVQPTSEKRTRQAEQLLTGSTIAGNAHLVLIEEAHALPVATLKHLKRLHERMRLHGRKPMLGILLLGQTELLGTLSDSSHAVREVVQRLELVQLHPLDHHLKDYLQFRARLAGTELDRLMTPCAVDAIRGRLTVVRQGVRSRAVSMLYPLAVNNLVTASLNSAAQLGVPKVTGELVRAL